MMNMNELAKTSAFDGVVAGLIKSYEGELQLRKSVADWCIAGGTIQELHAKLKELDDERCHASLKRLRNVQSYTRGIYPIPAARTGRPSLSPMGETRPMDPDNLSALLPTKRDAEAFKVAPLSVKQQVVEISNHESPNEKSISIVRELINANYNIDVSHHSKEELGEMLVDHSAAIDGLRYQCAANDAALAATMSEFGSFNAEGLWYAYDPIKIIKNLIPSLSKEDKQTLIDFLLPTINV
jgi:hypothetical protein